MWRQERAVDAASRTQLIAREQRLLGAQMTRLAHRRAVAQVVAAVGPESPLDDVVRVAPGGGTLDAAMTVAREHGGAKDVARQQKISTHKPIYTTLARTTFRATASRRRREWPVRIIFLLLCF